MPAPVLQFKRGNAGVAGTVPALRPGEPAISLNNFDLFVGFNTTVAGNKFFGSHRYWAREDGTTSLRLKLVDRTGVGGTIELKTPDSHTGVTTYTLPSTPVAGNFLKVDANGNLSWDTVTSSASFTNSTLTGVTTITGRFDNQANTSHSGITTFTNATDNTLGNSNTGAVQIDGGLGVDKNLTVGANLNVQGYSEFVGVVTFRGGIINIGDGTGDSINIGGRFSSSLVPSQDNTHDVGISTLNWRNAHFSGIGTFETGAVINGVRIGLDGANEINTTSGDLRLNSASGTTIIDDAVTIQNNLTVNGNVTVGGTTVTLRGQDVFIENKDLVLGYTTSITPNDDTANHAGVAIASTIGTPLANFNASGINTLPSTYKQLMWFKSGTLGFSTDAFAFNYGVAIGTTIMANGVRLAVGSGITMSDTAITATTVTATTGNFTNLSGNLTGTISTATRANTVLVTEDDTNTGSLLFAVGTGATSVLRDDQFTYNASSNLLSVPNISVSNDVNVTGFATFGQTITGTISTATNANNINISATTSTDTTTSIVLVGNQATGNQSPFIDSGLSYNANTDSLTITGDLDVNGGDVNTTSATASIFNANATTVNAFQAATNIVIGADTGITTFRNSVRISDNLRDSSDSAGTPGQFLAVTATGIGWTTITGVVAGTISTATRAQTVDVSEDDTNTGSLLFAVGTGATSVLRDDQLNYNASTNLLTTAGNIAVNGGDVTTSSSTANIVNANATIVNIAGAAAALQIGAATGITTVRNKLNVGGNLEVDGNNIQASDGNNNITLTSNTLTTFAGDIRVNGNDIQSSTGANAITLSGSDVSVVGDLTVTGNDIKSSTGTPLTLSGNDVTVNGNLYVSGSTTQVNTTALTVEDRTIDLGIVNGATPSSATTWDLGVLFNYHSGGSAKKSAVIWEHADSRFKFASVLSADTDGTDNNSPQLTVTTYSPIEVSSLWINGCGSLGALEVIKCDTTQILLQDITVDAGTF